MLLKMKHIKSIMVKSQSLSGLAMGVHIVKRTDTRISLGEVEIAHILITDTTSVGEGRINDVFSKLNKGKDFGLLAKKYSNDTNTKIKGGKLPKFGTGRMVKPLRLLHFLSKTKVILLHPSELVMAGTLPNSH